MITFTYFTINGAMQRDLAYVASAKKPVFQSWPPQAPGTLITMATHHYTHSFFKFFYARLKSSTNSNLYVSDDGYP